MQKLGLFVGTIPRHTFRPFVLSAAGLLRGGNLLLLKIR